MIPNCNTALVRQQIIGVVLALAFLAGKFANALAGEFAFWGAAATYLAVSLMDLRAEWVADKDRLAAAGSVLLEKDVEDFEQQLAALTCERNELAAANEDLAAERDAAVAKLLKISELIDAD